MATRNNNPSPISTENQNKVILSWLIHNPEVKISGDDGKRLFGTMKLSTRLGEICNMTGIYAKREFVPFISRSGHKSKYCVYWFSKEQSELAKESFNY